MEDLKSHLLLSVPSTWSKPDDWDYWLDAAGIVRGLMTFGPVFDNYPLVVQHPTVLVRIRHCPDYYAPRHNRASV